MPRLHSCPYPMRSWLHSHCQCLPGCPTTGRSGVANMSRYICHRTGTRSPHIHGFQLPQPSLFGPDSNLRGEQLEEFIFAHTLSVENVGQTPTFRNVRTATCIDTTLSRDLQGATVAGWRVDDCYNASDHASIHFSVLTGFERILPSRPWAKADWATFHDLLREQHFYIPNTMTQKKLDKLVQKLYAAIDEALNIACPMTPGHLRDRNNIWFTEWMEALRVRVERHYRRQRRSPTPQNIDLFKTT